MNNTIGAIFLAAAVLAAPLAISLAAVASSESIPFRPDETRSAVEPADYHADYLEYE